MRVEGTILPRIYRGRSLGKVTKVNAMRHSGGVCSRVQETHA
ncbi:hypothetical protein Golob_015696, partial [Gossypium lobatum]|nr:hypothetical protein [Gossypium lobatum]